MIVPFFLFCFAQSWARQSFCCLGKLGQTCSTWSSCIPSLLCKRLASCFPASIRSDWSRSSHVSFQLLDLCWPEPLSGIERCWLAQRMPHLEISLPCLFHTHTHTPTFPLGPMHRCDDGSICSSLRFRCESDTYRTCFPTLCIIVCVLYVLALLLVKPWAFVHSLALLRREANKRCAKSSLRFAVCYAVDVGDLVSHVCGILLVDLDDFMDRSIITVFFFVSSFLWRIFFGVCSLRVTITVKR